MGVSLMVHTLALVCDEAAPAATRTGNVHASLQPPRVVQVVAFAAARPPASLGALGQPAPAGPAPQSTAMSTRRPVDDIYLPRSALTQPPVALGVVALAYPDDAPPGRLATRLTLFIDEAGAVRRIRIEGAGLPPPFERAVRSAFMASRWMPGEVHGREVKVRSLIEVEFTDDASPQG